MSNNLVKVAVSVSRVPTRTENLEKWDPVREKLANIEQTGKVGETYTKYWKSQRIVDNFYLFIYFCDLNFLQFLFQFFP